MKIDREKILKDGILKTSVSKVDKADPKSEGGCWRKWWFEGVVYLKQKQSPKANFGEVLHECCERFLHADDNGRDADGNPVDLFPEGWEDSTNRFTGKKKGNPINKVEQQECKFLVNAAIKEGVLTRVPGREIEKELNYIILSHEGIDISLKGFIDLAEPDAIIDHKTTSSTKYMKSLAKLKKNAQLVSYAYVRWEMGMVDKKKPQWLKHLYYLRDKKTGKLAVQKREVQISYADSKRVMNENVFPVLRKMVEYVLTAETYKDLPKPENITVTCTKVYGGCPYFPICKGECTEEDYNKRIERQLDKSKKSDYTSLLANEITNKNTNENKQGVLQMGSPLDNILAKAGAKQTKTTNTETAASKPAAAKKEPAAKPAATKSDDARPAMPYCLDAACAKCASSPVKGILGDAPCPICAAKGKAVKKILAADYSIDVIDNMYIVVDNNSGELVLEYTHEAEVASSEKSESIVEAEAKAKEDADKAAAEAEAEAKAAAEAEVKAQEEAQAKAEADQLAKDKEAMKKAEKEVGEGTSESTAVEAATGRSKGLLLLKCVYGEGGGVGATRATLGKPSYCMSGQELMNLAKDYLMKSKEVHALSAVDPSIVYFEDLNSFERKDLIRIKAPEIATLLGSSTVQVLSYVQSSDLHVLIEGISPYMQVITGIAN